MILHYFKLILAIGLTLQAQSTLAAQLSDALGDPLPERAVARLGSSRLRHGGRIDRVAFSPDGRKVASWGGEYGVSDGIAIWDAATGKELRRVCAAGGVAGSMGLGTGRAADRRAQIAGQEALVV